MRDRLAGIEGGRIRFRATVERFGFKKGWKGRTQETLLIKDVRRVNDEKLVTDHLWLTVGKTINRLNLKAGEIIEFDARVAEYIKGYVNSRRFIDERRVDYKLSNPTKFQRFETLEKH